MSEVSRPTMLPAAPVTDAGSDTSTTDVATTDAGIRDAGSRPDRGDLPHRTALRVTGLFAAAALLVCVTIASLAIGRASCRERVSLSV